MSKETAEKAGLISFFIAIAVGSFFGLFGFVNGTIETSHTILIQEQDGYKKQVRVFSATEFFSSLSLVNRVSFYNNTNKLLQL